MITSLVRYVRKHVNPEEYYKSIFPEVSWAPGSSEAKVLSPFIEEKEPSLTLNRETGAWYSFCASDRRGGSSIVSFQAAYDECSNKEAAMTIYHRFIHPVVNESVIRKYARRLYKTPTVLKYLRSRRLSSKVIKNFKLGWNGSRITIPIYNELDICTNVKMYDPSKKTKYKMINYKHPKESRSYGSPAILYPVKEVIEASPEEPLFICEGEWDVLSLIGLGLRAVTSTAGAGTWPGFYNELFKDRLVVLVYDNDKAGKEGAKLVFKQLLNIAKTIKQLEVPKKYGKDVNDYILKKPKTRIGQFWLDWVNRVEPLVVNPDKLVSTPKAEVIEVSLDQASNADYYNNRLRVQALVAGKDYEPYLLTKKARVICEGSCENCPIAESQNGYKELELNYGDSMILKMIDATDELIRRMILCKVGVPKIKSCKARVERLETFNVLRISIIPTLDSQSREYTTKTAYYIGQNLLANKAYQFEGVLVPLPKNQCATFLFDTARPLQSDIDSFELTRKQAHKLAANFKPKNLTYLGKLQDIADWQSSYVTKIINRPNLHIAVDLAFHSVSSFWFNQEFVPRGMLDILILGDTKCGKGYVTERLCKFYKLGDVASGDNCSFAGLVGGLQKLNSNWRISWGLLPLNHKRLVIIDEASSMTKRDISRMSRIRSEGVAELVKIIRETTQANVRLIWLSNPRSGNKMYTYNTGVEAVRELIGAVEDISRFDFVFTVATDEVASEDINIFAKQFTHKNFSGDYEQELFQALVMWAWSRKPEQVVFTDKATRKIVNKTTEFAEKYSSAIPIVQSENFRFKLAKISAAIAARTFSTDKEYEKLIVETDHVNCAVSLLNSFYTKPSMNYDQFSQTTSAASVVAEPDKVDEALKTYGKDELAIVTGLLEMHQISVDALADYVEDPLNTKNMVGDLVRARCLYRVEGTIYYNKSPDFIKLLRKKQKELLRRKRNE